MHILQRAQQLKKAGWTEETSTDLQSLMAVLRLVQYVVTRFFQTNDPVAEESTEFKLIMVMNLVCTNRQNFSHGGLQPPTNMDGSSTSQQQPQQNLPATPSASNPNANGVLPPAAPAAHMNMTPAQLARLRTQVHAFKQLNRNVPLPPHIQQAVMGEQAVAVPDGAQAQIIDKTVEGLIGMDKTKETPSTVIARPQGERPYAMEYDENSLVYPYNAVSNPMLYLERPNPDSPNAATKFQRLLVPSLMPKGLDPYLMLEERERYIQGRMNWRQSELEEMLALGGSVDGAKPVPNLTSSPNDKLPGGAKAKSSAQIRAMIELRALRLRDKQKLLREDMLRDVNAATRLPSERSDFRRMRTFTLRSAKETEDAERKQRLERERLSKDKHLQYVRGICDHGAALVETARRSNEKAKRLGLAVLRMHKDIEREEQKRLEKLAKERLKALKNDNEDGYRALIDQAKDTRITHLLKRTDAYLDSLANQVRLQQEDVKSGGQPRNRNTNLSAETNGEGSQGDYLAMTHLIKEPVSKQADLLIGGTLKGYQVQGLEWMVSLYNNKLNGILADEMVST